LPDSLKQDLQSFADLIKEDLPENAIFRDMGLGSIDVRQVFEQMITNFNLFATS